MSSEVNSDKDNAVRKRFSIAKFKGLLLASSVLTSSSSIAAGFSYDRAALPGAKPWPAEEFQNDPGEYQLVIMATGPAART